MSLIITGANGFVGKNLSISMKPFYPITNLNVRGLGNKTIELKGEALIHLAGKAHDLKRVSSADEYYNVNFELTKRLFDAFLKSDLKKFIFISSVKAAADVVDGVLTEEMIPDPQTHYGKSKHMAEVYIQSQPLPEGKSYYILRPCMIHGPGNKGNLNLLYKLVEMGIPYPLAAFENRRSFLSIDNLCFIIDRLLKNEIPSGIYNVADDEALSTKELVSILSESLNKKPKLWAVSSKLIRFIAVIGDKIGLPLNTERLNKLTENYVVSNLKIKKALGVDLPLSAKEGLKITASSFGKHN